MKIDNHSEIRELIRKHSYLFLLFVGTISFTSVAINLVPIANSARYKNSCIISAKKSLRFKNPDLKEYGINLDELASIEGYKFCIQPR